MTGDAEPTPAPPVAGLDSVLGFRALVELSPDAVFVILDGYHVFANARGLALFGARDLSELRTRPAGEFMDPSCRDEALARMRTLVEGRHSLRYVEERVIRLDGTPVDIEAGGAPIDVGGQPAALVVVRDITARKRAEAALRAAQARFQAAFRYAPSAIVLLNSSGEIVAVNPTMSRLTGRSEEDLLLAPCWNLALPEDRPAVTASFRVLIGRRCSALGGDFRYRRPDGSTGWVHARAAPLAGEQMFIVHLHDVTAAKQAGRELAVRAVSDPLTGLENRSRILDRLAVALRTPDAEVSVLFCDLDGFKQVNDRHGHAVGDEALVVVARRMRAVLAAADALGRIGGDEFAVVLSEHRARARDGGGGPEPGEQVARIASRIRSTVAEPMVIGGHLIHLGISIGAASSRAGGGTAEALLAEADSAMYRDKSLTRSLIGGS